MMTTFYNGSHWVAIDSKTSVVLALASTLRELQYKLGSIV